MALDGKSLQEYPVNAEVPQGFILEPTLFLLYVNDLDDIICNITIYADDATLYSKCEKASDLWQQLKLASELEFDQLDTIDLARKWLVDFQCCKNGTCLFEKSYNSDTMRKEVHS